MHLDHFFLMLIHQTGTLSKICSMLIYQLNVLVTIYLEWFREPLFIKYLNAYDCESNFMVVNPEHLCTIYIISDNLTPN